MRVHPCLLLQSVLHPRVFVRGGSIDLPQKVRAVLTFRCNSHAPHRRVGCGGRAEAAGGALEGPRLGKRSWRGQYFSELKCRQNLRLSIGLRPSLLAFHTTMSTASVAARNSFDLGAVGRRERTRTTRRLSQFSSAEEDEGDAAVSPSSPLFFFTTFLCLSPRCIFTAEVRIRARRGAQSSNL